MSEPVDREQVKRDAEALIAANPGEEVEDFGYDELRFAHACLALLAELEQAEKERDLARADIRLREASSDVWTQEDYDEWAASLAVLEKALAAWERE